MCFAGYVPAVVRCGHITGSGECGGMDIPEEALGPKMQALRDDRQRRFAWVMACGEQSAAEAARKAGYSDVAEGAKVQACMLLQRKIVIDAIEEASRCVLRGLAPLAIRRAKEVLEDREHPSHARMIETVLDRTGFFARTEHKVTVEHVDHARLAEIASRMAAELGVTTAKLIGPNVIEGEVERDTDPS